MHRLGTIVLWVAVLLTAVGLTFGFGALMLDADHQAVNLLGLVPIGFILLLTGLVMVLFGRSRPAAGGRPRREPD